MLKIKNITKIYQTEGFTQKALDDVSVNFRKCEFASILGPSGSGKTTFLNIIGGLDHYTSGDLIINDISTERFKDSDWDSYRNHRIGFVFQSYNLISHQTILANVKLALTLSGISKKEAIRRAKKALIDVGLGDHINKRPNQLSGGQMQRVAIARALVNDPDILLADEPTGALDTATSIQIMEVLKKISKKKLVIMVTHNPELANTYSNRIINLKDGKIISDSNPYDGKKEKNSVKATKDKKISMSFMTALGLSFNNLMTKKKRTILVAFAGSIGIIGIALILAVSTGFQNYVDSIQEETLTSYPLTIMQESTDIAGMLLSMRSSGGNKTDDDEVVEAQYITSMLGNVKANDLKSLKKHIEKNYHEIKDDVANIEYFYSIDPNIYTIDSTNKLAKVNPSNLFSTMMGSNSLMSSYSMMSSIYSQMVDNKEAIIDDYQMLAGRWPEKYDEMIIVLSEPGVISDLLVYSLGLRDNSELTEMITKIMNGEGYKLENEPLKFTYDDLLNVDLRLIIPANTYRYNSVYNVYEDMSNDDNYMMNLYNNNSVKLKIVGVVSVREGVNSMALTPGVNYTSDLIDYIVKSAADTPVVKKQLENSQVDVFSNTKFDDKNNKGLDFSNMISVDANMLKSAFNIYVDPVDMNMHMNEYTDDIKAILASEIKNELMNIDSDVGDNFNDIASGLIEYLDSDDRPEDTGEAIREYLESVEVREKIDELASKYEFDSETIENAYEAVLNNLLNEYQDLIDGEDNPPDPEEIIDAYSKDIIITALAEKISESVVDGMVRTKFLEKLNEASMQMSKNMASQLSIDEAKIASAFKINLTEEELMRVVSAMMNKEESNAKTNLLSLGYQDMEDPTYIAVYFSSFDGKEHFLSFLDKYNEEVSEDKAVNYSDTTGILMSSVKTIVNAVSYVLIAFVSISLVVSSIMIGIITYISVYERTKEIGILRSIGASKRNISSIFNAETFIIGLLSGLFGIGISYTLIPIINAALHHYTGNIPLRAALNISSALILVVLSIMLTLIGGLIPARAASKKDPVEALRSE